MHGYRAFKYRAVCRSGTVGAYVWGAGERVKAGRTWPGGEDERSVWTLHCASLVCARSI